MANNLAADIAAMRRGADYTVGQMLPLESIRMDGGTQARAGLDNATVAEYAETWLNLSQRQNGLLEMPPIVVFHDGSSYWLADGFHRVEAYRQFFDSGNASASPRAIRAVIQQGTQRDAILFACGANDTHGLRRTQADKRRAIERLLKDDEWRQWSDSEIARRCNVDHKTVASVRAELVATGEIPSSAIRQSADGKRRDVTGIQQANERRKEAQQPSRDPGFAAAQQNAAAPRPIERARCTVTGCPEPGVGSHQLSPHGAWHWFCATHAVQMSDLRNQSWIFTPNDKGWLRLSHPDMRYPRSEPTVEAAIKAALELQAGYDRRDLLRAEAEALGQPTRPADATDDDHRAQIAQIRNQADALGVHVIWEDDEVILHWPDEDIDQLLGMSYGEALHWLSTDGVQQAAARAQRDTPIDNLTRRMASALTAEFGIPVEVAQDTLADLDTSIPADLEQAGYFWQSAAPPIIAHNDGWRGQGTTVELALQLATDRKRQKGEAADRRLTPGAYAQILTLLSSIRADVITYQYDQAEAHARQLVTVIVQGEVTD